MLEQYVKHAKKPLKSEDVLNFIRRSTCVKMNDEIALEVKIQRGIQPAQHVGVTIDAPRSYHKYIDLAMDTSETSQKRSNSEKVTGGKILSKSQKFESPLSGSYKYQSINASASIANFVTYSYKSRWVPCSGQTNIRETDTHCGEIKVSVSQTRTSRKTTSQMISIPFKWRYSIFSSAKRGFHLHKQHLQALEKLHRTTSDSLAKKVSTLLANTKITITL